MLSYCLNCRKNTENKNLKVVRIIKIMLESKCVLCNIKKSNFIKQQEAVNKLIQDIKWMK